MKIDEQENDIYICYFYFSMTYNYNMSVLIFENT